MEPMSDASTIERGLINKAKLSRSPITGSLELLPLCNMNCRMCYVRLSRAEQLSRGALHTAEEYLALGRQMIEAGTLFLLLTGGEPLLYPDFRKLYLGLKQMGLILTINTNGTLIDEEWADFFAAHKPRRINITLYGASEQTYETLCRYPGGFSRTMNAIRLLRERDVDVKIALSPVRDNYADIPRIFDLGYEMNLPVHVDAYMMTASRERPHSEAADVRLDPEDAAKVALYALERTFSPDIFEQYVDQTLDHIDRFTPAPDRKMSCLAGNCSFTVNWQGLIRGCVIMDTPSVPVFETGFSNAWHTISNSCRTLETSEKCRLCRLSPICRTCVAAAITETGQPDGVPDYLCRYSEAYYVLLKELAELHKSTRQLSEKTT